MLQAAASGLGSVTGPLTPAMKPWALPVEAFKEWYTPNPERAKKLLADAGFPSGFKTTLKVIPTFPTMVAGAQVIAAQLKKIGIDAQIIQEEYGVWIKAIIKPSFDYDLTMNITTGDADPDSLLYRRFHSVEKQWNNDGDPEIDVLLDQGKLTVDLGQAQGDLRQGPAAHGGAGHPDLDLRAGHDRRHPELRPLRRSTSPRTTTASAPSGWSGRLPGRPRRA